MPADNAAALSLSSTIRSGLRPMLRPCKDDIETLTRMHPLKGGLGTPQEKAAEARALLLAHGALITSYPCWHPIQRFLAHLENVSPLGHNPVPPHDPFDHYKKFQWALIGWPYSRVDDLYEFARKHRDALAQFHLRVEVGPSVLYTGGAEHAVFLSIEPLLVRWYRGLMQEGWLAVLQQGFTTTSIAFSHSRSIVRMEAYEPLHAEYYGSSKGHPGLHGFVSEAFDTDLVRRMEPWHYAFQYRLLEDQHGRVDDDAYECLIKEIGPEAPELVKDALLAARSM